MRKIVTSAQSLEDIEGLKEVAAAQKSTERWAQTDAQYRFAQHLDQGDVLYATVDRTPNSRGFYTWRVTDGYSLSEVGEESTINRSKFAALAELDEQSPFEFEALQKTAVNWDAVDIEGQVAEHGSDSDGPYAYIEDIVAFASDLDDEDAINEMLFDLDLSVATEGANAVIYAYDGNTTIYSGDTYQGDFSEMLDVLAGPVKDYVRNLFESR